MSMGWGALGRLCMHRADRMQQWKIGECRAGINIKIHAWIGTPQLPRALIMPVFSVLDASTNAFFPMKWSTLYT